MKQETFEGTGGLKIFFRVWQPDDPARGVVVINHGFNAHSGQYTWAGEALAAHGLAVYALDMRGRGKSEGERFYVQSVDDHVGDLHKMVRIAKEREPGLPVFLLGHSAGGVVSCVYALEHQNELAGLICEDFAHEVPAPDFALSFLKAIARVAPHVGTLKLKNKLFSRDPAIVAEMNSDPLIANEKQPAQTMAALIDADRRLRKEFDQIRIPVLIMHGKNDQVTKPSGSQFFFDHTGSTDKTLKLYEGGFHDLLRDTDKQVVLSDIEGWIDRRVS